MEQTPKPHYFRGSLLAATLFFGAQLAHSATILNVDFGSGNDGFGGFTTVQTGGSWNPQSDSLRYTNNTGNWQNSGMYTQLSGANELSTTAGSSYTFTTVINSTGVSASGFDPFGMVLFSDSSTANTVQTGNVIKVMLWSDGKFYIHPGGISRSTAAADGEWTGLAPGEGIFTFQSTVTFTDTHADVSFTLTDSAIEPTSSTIDASISLADINLGNSFGVGTRNQGSGSAPFSMDVQSFSIIPEPNTALLVGLLGGFALLRRRR